MWTFLFRVERAKSWLIWGTKDQIPQIKGSPRSIKVVWGFGASGGIQGPLFPGVGRVGGSNTSPQGPGGRGWIFRTRETPFNLNRFPYIFPCHYRSYACFPVQHCKFYGIVWILCMQHTCDFVLVWDWCGGAYTRRGAAGAVNSWVFPTWTPWVHAMAPWGLVSAYALYVTDHPYCLLFLSFVYIYNTIQR